MSTIIEKIGLLLAQAERTDNENEAAAFTAKAQSLATTNAVDLAVARQAIAHREKREQPVQKSIHWGALGTKNTKKHLVNLFSSVCGHNDVKINIYHSSAGVIAFGFPSDIEVVEALFASLAVQMVDAGDRYVRSGAYKGETVFREKRTGERNYWGEYETVYGHFPVDGRTARASFYEGFRSRISRRLRDARHEALEAVSEVDVVEADESGVETHVESSAALVLIAKGVEVQDFYKTTSNARGSWSGTSSSSHSSGGYAAGTTAGASARLSGQRSITGGRTAISA